MTKDIYDGKKRTQIDYKINLYSIKCIKIMFVSVILMWILNYVHIFIVDMTLVTKGLLISCLLLFFTIAVAYRVDLHQKWVKYFLITGVVLTLTVLGITLTYHTLLLSVMPLLIATQYANKRTTLYAYILTIISTFVIVIGGYEWGLCDANMLLLTTERTADFVKHIDNGVYVGQINPNPAYTLVMYYAIPRSILLTIALPVIQSISENILSYQKYAVDMKQLSEKDEMTGLYNRNKYLSMVEEHYTKVNNVAVVFMDINNLKQTNDNLGHDRGDKLITNVSRCIMALTDVHINAYRIGGDEFVAIIENPKEDEVQEFISRFEEIIQMKSKAKSIELSVAIGYACGKGADIEKIIKQADESMYVNKKKEKL